MKMSAAIASVIFLGLAGGAAGPGAFAQEAAAQQSGGAGYKEYRAELIAKGWKPNVGYGLKTAKGQSLYKYPEVVCGPQLCFAKWRDKGGEEQTISLLRGQDGADHQVAQ